MCRWGAGYRDARAAPRGHLLPKHAAASRQIELPTPGPLLLVPNTGAASNAASNAPPSTAVRTRPRRWPHPFLPAAMTLRGCRRTPPAGVSRPPPSATRRALLGPDPSRPHARPVAVTAGEPPGGQHAPHAREQRRTWSSAGNDPVGDRRHRAEQHDGVDSRPADPEVDDRGGHPGDRREALQPGQERTDGPAQRSDAATASPSGVPTARARRKPSPPRSRLVGMAPRSRPSASWS